MLGYGLGLVKEGLLEEQQPSELTEKAGGSQADTWRRGRRGSLIKGSSICHVILQYKVNNDCGFRKLRTGQ